MKRLSLLGIMMCGCIKCMLLFAHQTDSPTTGQIDEVTIVRYQSLRNPASGTPIQQYDRLLIENMNALQVSDIVKHFSGVVVKDFGGVGGMKTVSVRGLGANHTAVGYDGIILGDMQSGQIDIGRYSLQNVSSISLINGYNENIFRTARSFSAASLLNIEHLPPVFREGRKSSYDLNVKGGSFGYINPAVYIQNKWTESISTSLSGEYLRTDGNYPFVLHYGIDNDSTYKRKNTDVLSFCIEPAFYASFKNNGFLSLKSYYFQSERGLPGAVLYYAPNHSTQRLWDKNFFTQMEYKQPLSSSLLLGIHGKYNWSYQHYYELTSSNQGKDYIYYQNEYYTSSMLAWYIHPAFHISFSNDFFINQLRANTENFPSPLRIS
ncbi:MAG: TonB-dependent receptor plug domain-containing protein [Candidatus Azobacteroides sp.]|nr:TonB-dependent receptor plug domain-containing protein [Candidatus Azobacteroides sp.]